MNAQVTCNRCNGYGKLAHFSHIANGTCFACEGTGKLSFRKNRRYQPARHPHAVENPCTENEWLNLLKAYGCLHDADNEGSDRLRRRLRELGARANPQCVTSEQVRKALKAAA